jgi:hypothetical protein
MKARIPVSLLTFLVLGASQQVFAHVEYYDLNQGAQISDLTAAGKLLSKAQYGGTPGTVLGLAGAGLTTAQRAANGIGAAIQDSSDRPLNNQSQWKATNQSYTGVGTFTGVTYTPASSTATVDVNDVTDFGWGNGTTAALGDSHKVDFFNFRLSQASTVTITWNVDADGTFIDSAFSLFSGVLNYQGHDDANEKLNPVVVPTGKVQDVLDTLTAPVDAQGIASAYRNTLTNANPYVGQFNALANWGQANVSGDWGNIAFLKGVNANGAAAGTGFSANAGDTLETLVINLLAGNYTIAASGALSAIANNTAGTLGAVESFGLTNLHGRLTFAAVAAAPVPAPAAIWLLGSALTGLVTVGRRRAA